MSYVQARADIVAAAEAARVAWSAWPLKLDYQNRDLQDVDHDNLPYVAVNIYFIDGRQLSMGHTKDLRREGQVHLVACAPERGGFVKQLALHDHFAPYFELKNFSTVRTHASRPGGAPDIKNGWSQAILIVPFWFDELVTTP